MTDSRERDGGPGGVAPPGAEALPRDETPQPRDGASSRDGTPQPRDSAPPRDAAPPQAQAPQPRDGAPPRDETTAQQQRDPAAVHRFIERFASVLALSGIPRMPARVLAVFLTSDASRLTAADIARTLQISPAAVSGAVRYLGDVGLISREAQPGSRRYWYRMPDNTWHEVVKLRDQLMRRWADVMHEGLGILGPGTPAGGRLAESLMYIEFVQKELPMVLTRWEEYKAAHDPAQAAGPPAADR